MLASRCSTDFNDLDACRAFIAGVVGRANAHRAKRIEAECALLRDLAAVPAADCEEISVQVSGFIPRRVFYTLASHPIGYRLGVRLCDDRLELFLGGILNLDVRLDQSLPGFFRKWGSTMLQPSGPVSASEAVRSSTVRFLAPLNSKSTTYVVSVSNTLASSGVVPATRNSSSR